MKSWTFAVGLVALLSGCSVTALAERERSIAVNRCEENQDCGPDLVCVEQQCRATGGQLTNLLVEVTPTDAKLAGRQLFKMATGISPSGGNYALTLAGLASVNGWVYGNVPQGCTVDFERPEAMGMLRPATDGSIPARVTFLPSERSFGLSARSLTANVAVKSLQDTYSFSAQLAAGTYDLYVEPYRTVSVQSDPTTPQPPVCSLPPQLIRGVALEDGNTKLDLKLPSPTRLKLEVRWPEDTPTLNGWTVDMIEPFTGRVVSTVATLSMPTSSPGQQVYAVEFDYLPVAATPALTTVDEIVRLTPPNTVIAPTVLFQRSALELFARGSAVIDQLTPLQRPVAYEGQIVDAATHQPERANVTLVATELVGVPKGVLTSFVRSVETREDGTFSVDLLPGTYHALVVPLSTAASTQAPFSSLQTTIGVAVGPARQAGRALALERAMSINGSVLTSENGSGARGALVTAEVSPSSVNSNVFARALDKRPLIPRVSGAVIEDTAGSFTIYAESGVFDFSARPPEGSGFAWLVQPGIDLTQGPIALDGLSLPGPWHVTFNLALPSGDSASLVGAHVRAYALLAEPHKLASSAETAVNVVPVGEGRVDERGDAALVLPARLEGVEP